MSMPCVCHFVAVAAASFSGWSIRTTQKVHCCSMFSAFRGDCTHSANSNDFVQLKYLSKNKRKVVCNGRNSKFREAPSAPTPLRAHIICSCVRYGAVIYVTWLMCLCGMAHHTCVATDVVRSATHFLGNGPRDSFTCAM